MSALRIQERKAYATAGWLKIDKELLWKWKRFSRNCQNVVLFMTQLSRLANPIGCDEQLPNMGRADAIVPLVSYPGRPLAKLRCFAAEQWEVTW